MMSWRMPPCARTHAHAHYGPHRAGSVNTATCKLRKHIVTGCFAGVVTALGWPREFPLQEGSKVDHRPSHTRLHGTAITSMAYLATSALQGILFTAGDMLAAALCSVQPCHSLPCCIVCTPVARSRHLDLCPLNPQLMYIWCRVQ
jgi:hypothetical protein